ncbi:hypothetical protein ABVK25_002053 [Lepraria finkii]|uniref:Heterokaryon incompatibility domain-containing protein n=1 Tax=Lepraria finkii TaxID=1340010 RepID=A0ABR4BIL6_9LECA
MAAATGVKNDVEELTNLFDESLQLFEGVEFGQKFEDDVTRCQLELDVVRLRLSRWGAYFRLCDQAVGLRQLRKSLESFNTDEAAVHLRLCIQALAQVPRVRKEDRSWPRSRSKVFDSQKNMGADTLNLRAALQRISSQRQGCPRQDPKPARVIAAVPQFQNLMNKITQQVDILSAFIEDDEKRQKRLCFWELWSIGTYDMIQPLNEIAANLEYTKTHLNKVGNYVAVSYIWKSTEFTRKMDFPGGFRINYTESAKEVLDYVGQKARSWFWLDAFCIDQLNPVEKAKQIGLMAEIYSSSVKEVGLLGSELTFGGEALRLAEKLYTFFRKEEAKDRQVRDEDLQGIAEPERWDCLSDLLANKFFTRMWIAEEMIMAPIKHHWFRADDGAILASADYTCSFLVFAYTVNKLHGIGFGTGVYMKHLDVFPQAMPSAIAIGEFREKRIAGIAIPMAEALQQSYQFSAHKSIDKIFAIKNFVQKDDFSRRVF